MRRRSDETMSEAPNRAEAVNSAAIWCSVLFLLCCSLSRLSVPPTANALTFGTPTLITRSSSHRTHPLIRNGMGIRTPTAGTLPAQRSNGRSIATFGRDRPAMAREDSPPIGRRGRADDSFATELRHTLEPEATGCGTCSRRDALGRPLARLVVGGCLASSAVAAAASCAAPAAAASPPAPPSYCATHPIVAIVGAGGRTGMAAAEAVAARSSTSSSSSSDEGPPPCTAVTMTRSGKDPFQIVKLPPEVRSKVLHYPEPVDVRDEASVLAALKSVGAYGVIFAASASRQGGNAADVDDVGAGNVARAVRAVGGRMVLLSALAVDRPDSKSYQVTNSMGGYVDGIMDRKMSGEERVRDVFGRGVGNYVIVRPGVLLSGKTRGGAADLELNQGDTIGGGLSRDELAGVAVGALLSGRRGVTVEAYRKSTRTKLQPDFSVPSGNEMSSEDYVALFENAKIDT